MILIFDSVNNEFRFESNNHVLIFDKVVKLQTGAIQAVLSEYAKKKILKKIVDEM